jgi:hypothetical protein
MNIGILKYTMSPMCLFDNECKGRITVTYSQFPLPGSIRISGMADPLVREDAPCLISVQGVSPFPAVFAAGWHGGRRIPRRLETCDQSEESHLLAPVAS